MPNEIKTILSESLIGEMIDSACRLVTSKGLMTRSEQLLDAARKTGLMIVRDNRLIPSHDMLDSCLAHLKATDLLEPDKHGNHHGWPDMLVKQDPDQPVLIWVSDRPSQYCDLTGRQILPLTRSGIIEGTKLLHVLSIQKGIKGYSCGVPQDTAAPLKPVEQYMIGYMYNRNGGGTTQAIDPEVEEQFAEIRCIAEGREDMNERTLMLWSPSPMILDADDLYLCFKPGIRITAFMVGSMPMMGITGPVDPIGVYILAIAEVIGAATILHALFPRANVYIYPHPQAVDMRTGQMAFGTREHARLEIIKMQVMKALGLRYCNVKDIMTSAQMPGSMAQGDKALGFYSGIMAGYRAFNFVPLSTDEVWSPVQTLLDIEAIEDAWEAMKSQNYGENVSKGVANISEILDSKELFAESEDTVMNMRLHYNLDTLHQRFFSSELWKYAGKPLEYDKIINKTRSMIDSWDYQPDEERLERMFKIYLQLCRKFHTDPLPIS